MKSLVKIGLLALLLTGAACTKKSDFDNSAAEQAAKNGVVPGSASDPTSPAYFQQAIGDRVYFAVDQSTLSSEAREILAKEAAWMIENASYTAIIEGHADEQGTRQYNLALGAARANAVQTFLIGQGVAPNRLRTISYGKERPVEICSAEACYAKNRRAVTVLAAGASTS